MVHDYALFEPPARPPVALWKKIIAVLGALAAAPFIAVTLGMLVILVAPFAVPVLPIIAVTLFLKERPAIVPVGAPARVRRPVFAHT